MEPHHLDGAGCVGDNRFAHGDAALPRLSRIEFADGAKYGHRLSRGDPRYRGFAPALVVADGEVVEKVA